MDAPNILIGPNNRRLRLFIFERIVCLKIDGTRIIESEYSKEKNFQLIAGGSYLGWFKSRDNETKSL